MGGRDGDGAAGDGRDIKHCHLKISRNFALKSDWLIESVGADRFMQAG